MGLSFEVVTSSVEEVREAGERVDEYVARLASEKARQVAASRPDAVVIGADTVVWIDGTVLEKPADAQEAITMLETIAGREHTVYTGVCVVREAAGHADTTVTASKVRMLALHRADIEWYVGTGEPLDKAGAYAVQGLGGWFIESIEGSYTNVVGLPLSALFEMLRRAGVDPLRAVP